MKNKKQLYFECVELFPQAKILCLGDVMLDRFVEGKVRRISPESPVPVFESGPQELVPGGAANVAFNILALGAQCTVVGVVGEDIAARELLSIMEDKNPTHVDLMSSDDRPTTEKIRFVTNGHQVLRVDTEIATPIPESIQHHIIEKISNLIDDHDLLILSDYAKGVLTDRVVKAVIALANESGKIVIVDPKAKHLSRYSGATVITPNTKELHEISGIDPSDNDGAINAGRAALDQGAFSAILLTRGDKGMTLIAKDTDAVHISSTKREVYDVVGAGDTVVATLATAMAAGADLEVAAHMANIAGGIVVAKQGTATVSPDELMIALEDEERGSLRRGAPIMLSSQDAVKYANARKDEGKKVGFTNGVFDLLHPGHISLLQSSRDECDCLIVGLNSDASVRRLKGPARPINSTRNRSVVLGALGAVDVIVVFETDTPLDLIKAIRPDVLLKGADYSMEEVVGADVVTAYGGRVVLAELVPDLSSTEIIAKVQRSDVK